VVAKPERGWARDTTRSRALSASRRSIGCLTFELLAPFSSHNFKSMIDATLKETSKLWRATHTLHTYQYLQRKQHSSHDSLCQSSSEDFRKSTRFHPALNLWNALLIGFQNWILQLSLLFFSGFKLWGTICDIYWYDRSRLFHKSSIGMSLADDAFGSIHRRCTCGSCRTSWLCCASK